jgi:biotin operon repressor
MLTKDGFLPTNTQISTATGLSRVTIDKHLKENGVSIHKIEELDKYKLLNSIAINRLYKIGMTENNTKALKMFIDYTGEPKKTTINNNYIQINNTRIDSLLIDQLPEETRNQIEALILNNTLKTFYDGK